MDIKTSLGCILVGVALIGIVNHFTYMETGKTPITPDSVKTLVNTIFDPELAHE